MKWASIIYQLILNYQENEKDNFNGIYCHHIFNVMLYFMQ